MKPIITLISSLKKMGCLFKGRVPGQLVIQYTDKCNAKCPQCSMRVSKLFSRSKLDMDTARRIIDYAVENGIHAISFTGGEPLLFFDEIVMLLKYAKDAGIRYTRTGTNGFLFIESGRNDYEARIAKVAESLAETGIYTFWISIDSAIPALHEDMRGLPGVISGIEKALPIFREHGIYPSANLGINRNILDSYQSGASHVSDIYEVYREAFRKYYRFIIDLGFTMVNACYPMSGHNDKNDALNAVYGATSESHLVQFSSGEKVIMFQTLSDTITEFRSKIRIFSPQSSLYSLMRQYAVGEDSCYPCRGGKEFFFIDARNGDTYPCGYRGNENLGKFWRLDLAGTGRKELCRKCDWECFRDPSEMLGPLLSLFTEPAALIERNMKDSTYMKLWYKDLKYFSACGFFNGRIPPDYQKLSRYSV